MFIRWNSTINYYEYDSSAASDGSGPWIKLPNVVYRDSTNDFTADQRIYKVNPALYLFESDSPANARGFRLINSQGSVYIQACDDSGNAQSTSLLLYRNGDILVGGAGNLILKSNDSTGIRFRTNSASNLDVVSGDGALWANVHADKLYERARSIPLGEWQPYTPTWATAANPQPTLGNGSISGKYTVIGKTVHFSMNMSTGSTTTYGPNMWGFSPPLPISGHLFATMWIYQGVNGFNYIGVGVIATWFAAGPVSGFLTALFGSPQASIIQATVPFNWSTLVPSYLFFQGTYETT